MKKNTILGVPDRKAHFLIHCRLNKYTVFRLRWSDNYFFISLYCINEIYKDGKGYIILYHITFLLMSY